MVTELGGEWVAVFLARKMGEMVNRRKGRNPPMNKATEKATPRILALVECEEDQGIVYLRHDAKSSWVYMLSYALWRM